MHSEITVYEFVELPLQVTEDGRVGTFAEGVADIEYFADGRWRIAAVRTRVAKYELGLVPVYSLEPPPKAIAQIIELTLLQDDWAPRIQDKVWKELRAVDIEDRAFRRAYGRAVQV